MEGSITQIRKGKEPVGRTSYQLCNGSQTFNQTSNGEDSFQKEEKQLPYVRPNTKTNMERTNNKEWVRPAGFRPGEFVCIEKRKKEQDGRTKEICGDKIGSHRRESQKHLRWLLQVSNTME
ncbi:hypothetical protein Tco_0477777 [Tanacetum coccineum]